MKLSASLIDKGEGGKSELFWWRGGDGGGSGKGGIKCSIHLYSVSDRLFR